LNAPDDMGAITLPPGALLEGRYRLLRLVGRGGMGLVYQAEDTQLGRVVALKLLHPQKAGDATMLARFRQEARASASIGHPGIVDVLDLGQTRQGAPYFVMEFLVGETLGQRLERERRLPIAETVWILSGVLDALEAAHACGIVHRDLKPDNIFLVADPVGVKVLDFGISKLQGEGPGTRLTNTGVVIGTPRYMSPEQARGSQSLGPASDLFSLGSVMYRMLAGVPPFTGATNTDVLVCVLGEPHRPLCEVQPAVPVDLSLVCDMMLAKEAGNRMASAGAARDLIRMAVGALGAGTPPRPYTPPETTAAPPAVEPESTVTTPGR